MVDAEVESSMCNTPAAPRTSRSVTPTPSTSSSGPSKSSSRDTQHRKRQQNSRGEEIDMAILEGLKEARTRREKKSEAEHNNPDCYFGKVVGERLYRMTPHQSAIAKVRIQQVLLEIEFPNEQQYYQHSVSPSIPEHLPPPPHSQSSNFYPTCSRSNTFEL